MVDVSMMSMMMESVVWSDMMMMTLESVLQWYLLHSVQVRALPLHNFPETREIRKSNEWSVTQEILLSVDSFMVPDVYLTRWSVRHHNVLLVLLAGHCPEKLLLLSNCSPVYCTPVHTAVVLLQCCCDQGSRTPPCLYT